MARLLSKKVWNHYSLEKVEDKVVIFHKWTKQIKEKLWYKVEREHSKVGKFTMVEPDIVEGENKRKEDNTLFFSKVRQEENKRLAQIELVESQRNMSIFVTTS